MPQLKHESAAPPAEGNGAEISHTHDRTTTNDHPANIGESFENDNEFHRLSVLREVRSLAERGLYIMPVRPEDKKPLVGNWRKWSRPLSPDQAESLFAQKWERCGPVSIGLMTGKANRLTVIDVDHPARDSLRAASERFGNTPLIAKTGGGWHLFYTHAGEKNAQDIDRSGLGFRVDVRGEGGFVVVAPSRHKTGRAYRWHRGGSGSLFDLPDIEAGSLVAESPGAANTNSAAVAEGGRTDALMAEFRRIRPMCLHEADAITGLLRFRDERLDTSSAAYPDSEVEKIARSLWASYDPRKAAGGRENAYVPVREADLVGPEMFGPLALLCWLRLRNPHGKRFAIDGRSVGAAMGVTRDKIESARAKLVAAGKLTLEHKGTGRKVRGNKRDASLYSFAACSVAGADIPSQCITVNPSPPDSDISRARDFSATIPAFGSPEYWVDVGKGLIPWERVEADQARARADVSLSKIGGAA